MGQNWAWILGTKAEVWNVPMAVRMKLIQVHRKTMDALDAMQGEGTSNGGGKQGPWGPLVSALIP
jgi:hypothetical protein